MLREMNSVIKGLGVYPANMSRNMNIYGGVVFSQKVLLALVNSGMKREEAYKIVQKNAHEAWNKDGGNFKQNIQSDPDVLDHLSSEKLSECFNSEIHKENLQVIWERLGL